MIKRLTHLVAREALDFMESWEFGTRVKVLVFVVLIVEGNPTQFT